MLLDLFCTQDEFNKVLDLVSRKKDHMSIGTQEDIWPFLIAFWAKKFQGPLLAITSTRDRAQELAVEISGLLSCPVLNFPSPPTSIYYKNKPPDLQQIAPRLKVLKEASKCKCPLVIVASINACLNLMNPQKLKMAKPLPVFQGNTLDRNQLVSWLLEQGYERVNMVYDRGEFSIRGSIVDIFDVTMDSMLRLDFYGDEVEKIYSLDPATQKKLAEHKGTEIFPYFDPWQLEAGKNIMSLQQYLRGQCKSLTVAVCDPVEVKVKMSSDRDILAKILEEDLEKTVLDKIDQLDQYLLASEAIGDYASALLELNSAAAVNASEIKLGIEGQKRSFAQPETFIENLKKDFKLKKKVYIAVSNPKRKEKIKKIITENGLSFTQQGQGQSRVALLLDKNLLHGFRAKKVSVYGELDIYQKQEIIARDEIIQSLKELESFQRGQYLVHKTHGIGRYVDIVSRQVGGYKKDYFLIEYANRDKLYVPTWQADRITRYIGQESPQINTLNSRQWEQQKRKVRNSVKKLAFDLSLLYAQRQAMEGHPFVVDTPWQREISNLFPFTETPDQVKAIEKVNQAMAQPKPMDMLVCGDVGFGKTEVAIRAAFAAIESGKQVMMLVPTTILSDQHYQNFNQRYRDYPVQLEVLTRFRKKSSQNKIIEAFNQGKIDMLIGTHRILQNDVNPPNLGLIIVDEEQRFGVGSKEKIKLLKKNADVLTLTATPIPRTLYMSLTGIRDMVAINTHPEGRNPIETFVGEKDDLVVKQAIEREIGRGGQIYYVFNHIKGIQSRMEYLQRLVPQAKIALTHGRMKGKKIEQVMSDFVDRKYHILLTTTIIESGMDISNVNTLMVENAHNFGLSQLHQLRGRVGRSTERAYAYFFYPKMKNLSLTSLRRLKALAEYTDLGAGYSIALRDMEIRGAGELLGPRQSGHMGSVGFDMYCQIIKEEVAKLKGQEVKQDINVQIEVPLSAYIPKSFIPKEKDRLNLYRNLGQAENIGKIEQSAEAIKDRYGNLPPSVSNLIYLAKIKNLMQQAEISSMVYHNQNLIFKKLSLDMGTEKLKNIDPHLSYNHRGRQLVLKIIDNHINLGLVYNILNVIINTIDLKKEKRLSN